MFQTADNLQIDDTNEGELYDGQDKRIDSKKLENDKVDYDFKSSKQKPANLKQKQTSPPSDEPSKASVSNGFKTSSIDDTLESKLEERARKLKEKNESDKNDLLRELKFKEEKPTEPHKRTFQLTTNSQNKSASAASNIVSGGDPKDFVLKPIDFETAKVLIPFILLIVPTITEPLNIYIIFNMVRHH